MLVRITKHHSLLGKIACYFVAALLAIPCRAVTEKVLHNFTNAPDGADAWGQLISDQSGNLYGTTYAGGYNSWGSVFELIANPDGTWSENILYNFPNGTEGAPESGLTFHDGSLYGTTHYGGAIFKLAPNPDGTWTHSVLYARDAQLNSPVVFDQQGNLYTTSELGGIAGCGAGCGYVLELSPQPDGTWQESTVYEFTGGKDGSFPTGLAVDKSGYLYVLAAEGGDPTCVGTQTGCGTIVKFVPNPGGGWSGTLLHAFHNDKNGAVPAGSPIFDGEGNLYGVTNGGGFSGTEFMLSPTPTGQWKHTVIHRNGGGINGSLFLDSSGNLYGATYAGGSLNGTVFRLSRRKSGSVRFDEYRFSGPDGKQPFGGVFVDTSGNIYGATSEGGDSHACGQGCGVVFEIMP